jgi:hypothetical protein
MTRWSRSLVLLPVVAAACRIPTYELARSRAQEQAEKSCRRYSDLELWMAADDHFLVTVRCTQQAPSASKLPPSVRQLPPSIRQKIVTSSQEATIEPPPPTTQRLTFLCRGTECTKVSGSRWIEQLPDAQPESAPARSPEPARERPPTGEPFRELVPPAAPPAKPPAAPPSTPPAPPPT